MVSNISHMTRDHRGPYNFIHLHNIIFDSSDKPFFPIPGPDF